MNNVLPQEIQDKIFLYLDYNTLNETRQLQSDYVKKCTEFSTLEHAVKNGNLQCVKYLFSKGYYKPKKNLINWAAEYGHLEVVKFLHENRTEGCTIYGFQRVVENGYLEIVKYLIEQRHYETNYEKLTIYAASNGRLEVVRWFNENIPNSCTKNTLISAASGGHLLVVKYLVELGTPYEDGINCKAVENHNFEIAEWLKKKLDEKQFKLEQGLEEKYNKLKTNAF